MNFHTAAFGKALGKPDAYSDPPLKESKDTYRVWDRMKGFTAQEEKGLLEDLKRLR